METRTPVKTQTINTFDDAGNLTQVEVYGTTDGPSPASNTDSSSPGEVMSGNSLLSKSVSRFDERERQYEIDKYYNASNYWTTEYHLDRLGRKVFIVEADDDEDETHYDGLGRLLKKVDTSCTCVNTIDYFYDDNGNLVKKDEIDKPTADATYMQSGYSETYESYSDYDSLDRTVFSTTPTKGSNYLGSYYRYDSKDNTRSMADAEGSSSSTSYTLTIGGIPLTTNNKGNVTDYFYDAASRLIKMERILTSTNNGDGTWAPTADTTQGGGDGKITTQQTWDKNSLLKIQTDDNSNETEYFYDYINRMWKTEYADSKTDVLTFNDDDMVTDRTDQNYSDFAYTYDAANRLTQIEVAGLDPGHNVLDMSTYQTFQYDGLGRTTKATDSYDTVLDDGDDIIDTFTYNFLSQILTEVQTLGSVSAKTVTSTYGEESGRTILTYPNGTTHVDYTYDSHRDRIHTVSYNDTEIMEYDFIGARVLQKEYNNGVILYYHTGNGSNDTTSGYYDDYRRVLKHENYKTTPTKANISTYEYLYDRMYNRTEEDESFDGGTGNLDNMAYDSTYRLTDFDRDGQTDIDWTLDGANNWTQKKVDTAETDYSNTVMNEYDEIDDNINPPVARLHDDNGNLTNDGTHVYIWDAFNRLREVWDITGINQYAEYNYDAFGRRVERIVTNKGSLNTHLLYFYDGPEVIEEYNESNVLQRRYVYGARIDEPLIIEETAQSESPLYYYHTNSLGTVMTLTDSSANVKERYKYEAYGALTVITNDANIGNPYFFTARRYDPETEKYYYRARYYDPEHGRFLNHDPIGIDSFGNMYTYCLNDPIDLTDPKGLAVSPLCVLIINPETREWKEDRATLFSPFSKEIIEIHLSSKIERTSPSSAYVPHKAVVSIGEVDITLQIHLNITCEEVVEGCTIFPDYHYDNSSIKTDEGVRRSLRGNWWGSSFMGALNPEIKAMTHYGETTTTMWMYFEWSPDKIDLFWAHYMFHKETRTLGSPVKFSTRTNTWITEFKCVETNNSGDAAKDD
ncbi:RHS repeat domain-containing protein [Planctomycetota bacterium]